MDKAGTLTHAGPPGFSACGGDRVDPWRAIAVGVWRRGLGWVWTPGRASWRIKLRHAWLTQEQGRGSPQPRSWRSGDGGVAGRSGPGEPELAREIETDRLVSECVGGSQCRFGVVQFLKRRGGARREVGRGACAAIPECARPRPGQRRAGVWGRAGAPSGSSRPRSPLPRYPATQAAVVSLTPAAGGASDWLRTDGRARIGCPGQGAGPGWGRVRPRTFKREAPSRRARRPEAALRGREAWRPRE